MKPFPSFIESAIFETKRSLEKNFSQHFRKMLFKEWEKPKFFPLFSMGKRPQFLEGLDLVITSSSSVENKHPLPKSTYRKDENSNYSIRGKNISEQTFLVRSALVGNYCFFGMETDILPDTKIENNPVAHANTAIKNNTSNSRITEDVSAEVFKRSNAANNTWERN